MKRPLDLRICLIIPALILITGAMLGKAYRSRELPALMKDTGQGMLPPGFPVKLPEPGNYTLWLHTRAEIDGVPYWHGKHLNEGGRIQLFDKDNRKEIQLQATKSKRSFQGDKAVALADFETTRSNQSIEVKASGLDYPALIGIAPNRKSESMNVLFYLLVIVCATLLPAFIALAILLHRRKKQMESVEGC